MTSFDYIVLAIIGITVIVCVLVLLAGLSRLPKEKNMEAAMLSQPLELLVESMMPWLPSPSMLHLTN